MRDDVYSIHPDLPVDRSGFSDFKRHLTKYVYLLGAPMAEMNPLNLI